MLNVLKSILYVPVYAFTFTVYVVLMTIAFIYGGLIVLINDNE